MTANKGGILFYVPYLSQDICVRLHSALYACGPAPPGLGMSSWSFSNRDSPREKLLQETSCREPFLKNVGLFCLPSLGNNGIAQLGFPDSHLAIWVPHAEQPFPTPTPTLFLLTHPSSVTKGLSKMSSLSRDTSPEIPRSK